MGVVFLILLIVCGILRSISDAAEDIDGKKNWRSKDGLTYLHGASRRIYENGHRCSEMYDDKTLHNVLYDWDAHRIYYDYTYHEIQKWLKYSETDKRMTVIPWTASGYYNWNKEKYPCQGMRYKDIETRRLYVIREYDWRGIKKFYMDIETGMFVRAADGQNISKTDEEYVVNTFNKKQRERAGKCSADTYFENSPRYNTIDWFYDDVDKSTYYQPKGV